MSINVNRNHMCFFAIMKQPGIDTEIILFAASTMYLIKISKSNKTDDHCICHSLILLC